MRDVGLHCQKLRKQRGYSIDRLAKESDRLSTSVIHRLERGEGPVNLLGLYRYAQALELHPKILLDVEIRGASALDSRSSSAHRLKLIAVDDPRIKREAFKTLLPVYSLRAAAGRFGSGETAEPEGWVKVPAGKLDRQMFVARAAGDSMVPRIRPGEWMVFRANPSGSRQGKIVLVQYRGPADPDTGASYAVKCYRSSKSVAPDGSWNHDQITLEPLNSEYEPLLLTARDEGSVQVIAEFLFVL